MGSKERRARERANLKANILAAAKKIANNEGWDAVTIRKIADEIEYSPPIIYEYFKDKNALLLEIRKEGYQKLFAKYQHALANSQNAIDILTKFGAAYWDFAWDHQELYKIMYGLEISNTDIKALKKEIEQIRILIKTVLADALAQSKSSTKFTDFNWEDAIDILRSMLHGTITFSMINALDGNRERARTLAMRGVKDLVTCWMKKN